MSSSTRWSRAERASVARGLRGWRSAAALSAALLLGALAGSAVASTQPVATAPASKTSPAPDHVRRYIDDARTLGGGRLTWFGLHIYDALLFVPRAFDSANPSAQPFALELTYARSLDGQAIAERSHDEIARLKIGNEAQRTHWLADMSALFPDVNAGQRLAGIYRPGGGTHFYLDGRYLGEVADPEFGRAFFAIWLDPRTSAPQLRASLLRPLN
jgi:Chalcone isomerase-like